MQVSCKLSIFGHHKLKFPTYTIYVKDTKTKPTASPALKGEYQDRQNTNQNQTKEKYMPSLDCISSFEGTSY